MKEYQTQEVLVAIAERVEEAQNFRRELKVLEEKEKERVNKLREEHASNEIHKLESKHIKEEKLLDQKLQNLENKLKIQMSKEYQVLEKQIGLHENEIERIHHSAATLNMNKGLYRGELMRNKDKSREQNKILEMTKQVGKKEDTLTGDQEGEEGGKRKGMSSRQKAPGTASIQQYMASYTSGFGNATFHSQEQTTRSQSQHKLNRFAKSGNILSFYLRQKFGSDLPVNLKENPFREAGDQHHKIERYLINKKRNKKDMLPKLSDLYDEELKAVNVRYASFHVAYFRSSSKRRTKLYQKRRKRISECT